MSSFLHFCLENHGSCVKDCKWAIKQNPEHLKAYIQGAKSLLILSKATETIEMCEAGLKIAPENEALTELKTKAVALEVLRPIFSF